MVFLVLREFSKLSFLVVWIILIIVLDQICKLQEILLCLLILPHVEDTSEAPLKL
jgi:hypothetical protein